MTDSLVSLRRQIKGAEQLATVVRAMKAVSAAAIGQYETAVRALEPYTRSVELALSVCLRRVEPTASGHSLERAVVIFGSDQGLVGRFNEAIVELAVGTFEPGAGVTIWCVGERIAPLLQDAGSPVAKVHTLPASVAAITSFVSALLLDIETFSARHPLARVEVFHHRPLPGSSYEGVRQTLLPLDESWAARLRALPWPTKQLPELNGDGAVALRAFVREFLFITLYRSCAESLASEHAARLAAMQRAQDNIENTSVRLRQALNRVRQSSIDEELFDVTAGFNALRGSEAR